jgi:hypothetical protein
MARAGTNIEVIKDITQAGYIMDASGGGNSTLTVAVTQAQADAKTQVTVTVASATGFLAGDLIRLGSANLLEENIVDSIAANVLTLRMPVVYAHAIGEAAVERIKVPLGEVLPGTFKVTPNATYNQIKTDTTKGVYITLYTDAMFTANVSIINHSLENLAFAHGLGEGTTVITGAGTTASPRRLVLTTQNLMQLQNISLYCVGHRSDGVTQEQQIWSVDLTPNGDRTYATGTGVPAPITAIGRANATLEYP